MNTALGRIYFVGGLVLATGLAQVASAGELVVTRQKDGTLLITNTGLPPGGGEPIPEVKEGVMVKEVQAPAVVREEAAAPREAASGAGKEDTATDGDGKPPARDDAPAGDGRNVQG